MWPQRAPGRACRRPLEGELGAGSYPSGRHQHGDEDDRRAGQHRPREEDRLDGSRRPVEGNRHQP
jgi:hypothetical protein